MFTCIQIDSTKSFTATFCIYGYLIHIRTYWAEMQEVDIFATIRTYWAEVLKSQKQAETSNS